MDCQESNLGALFLAVHNNEEGRPFFGQDMNEVEND